MVHVVQTLLPMFRALTLIMISSCMVRPSFTPPLTDAEHAGSASRCWTSPLFVLENPKRAGTEVARHASLCLDRLLTPGMILAESLRVGVWLEADIGLKSPGLKSPAHLPQ